MYPKFFASTDKKTVIMLIDERKLHKIRIVQNATTGEESYRIQVCVYTPEDLMAINRDFRYQENNEAFIAAAKYMSNVGGIEASFAALISQDQF